MLLRPWICMWIFLLAGSGVAQGHGIFHETSKKEAVVIAARYDDGEPASYVQVRVTPPQGGKIEHQNGRTDKNGCFAFLPDLPGQWKITIDDGLGHKIDTELLVDEASGIQNKHDPLRVFPLWQAVVTGLSLIFGFFGVVMCFRVRKLHRQDR